MSIVIVLGAVAVVSSVETTCRVPTMIIAFNPSRREDRI